MKAAARKPAARLGREQRVDEILVAARDLFCESGFDAVSMAQIAERIGVVEGTLYKYFDSKRALLLRVLERWYEDMFGDYARDLAGVTDTRGRIRLLVWRHLRSIRDYPQLCRLTFREVRGEPHYVGSGLHSMNRRYTQFLMDVLAQGVRKRELRDDIPVLLLRDMIYGCIEHHSWNYLGGRGALDIDRLADHIVAVVCDGIAVHDTGLRQETARLSKIVTRMEKRLGKSS
jgi:AcrR family transcriptional regulator